MSPEAKRIVAEETWRVSPGLVTNLVTNRRAEVVLRDRHVGYTKGPGTVSPELTIAACAPEALRLLQRIEFPIGGLYRGLCAVCRYGGHDTPGKFHADNCELDALFRKAGIR